MMIKKLLAAVLSCAMLLTGCAVGESSSKSNANESTTRTTVETTAVSNADEVKFDSLGDPKLLQYLDDTVYTSLVEKLDSDLYFVENVNAVYVSNEYIEDLQYNSQSNIYFGYTLKELENQFSGKKYVFSLDDDDQTVVKEFEEYDDTYEKVLKNVAVGTGVILVCVTVAILTDGAAIPAISSIFTCAAKTGTVAALSGGVISGVTSGVATGIETGDFNKAIKSAALDGSDGFKWGAITGAVSGGVGQAVALHGATLSGLTMNQAAQIQKESKLPLSIIKSFHNVDEYNIYRNAGLNASIVADKPALVRTINWNKMDDKNRTNAQRVLEGLSPIDDTGVSYELHHIGQKSDAPLSILTREEHMQKDNNKILHYLSNSNVDHGPEWQKTVKEFWKAFMEKTYTGA